MKFSSQYRSLLIIIITLSTHHFAGAQASRTWVSGVGDDANPCSRTAPCKTLSGAISKTSAGGEITVLDPTALGAVTITKSLTINSDPSQSNMTTFSGLVGVTINAAASDVINLRGFAIQGLGTGGAGINIISPSKVHIEDVRINNCLGVGININLTADGGKVSIKNTTITGSPTPAAGINVTTSTGTVAVAIANVYINGASTGINVNTGGIVTATHSIISLNDIGARAQNNGIINLDDCKVSGNVTGLVSETATSVLRISGTSCYDNTTGFGTSSGKFISYGNNYIAGNGGTLPPFIVIPLR